MISARIKYGYNNNLSKMDLYFSPSQKSGGRQSKAGEADLLHKVPRI